MRCERLLELEDERNKHREAAFFLSHHKPPAARKAVTHKLVLRKCRADQARLGRTIQIHQRNCPQCNWLLERLLRIPHQ